MGGGSNAQNIYSGGGIAADLINDRGQVGQNSKVKQALADYASGKVSKEDALSSVGDLGGEGGHEGFRQAALQDMFGTGAAGQRGAAEAVQSNPLLKGLFGQGGQFEQAQQEASNLASQGYQLQPEDYTAYGQASGNIARMFGQQEQDLSQSLANRGLGMAPSGAAGASFTGLQGNKNEQLARAQTSIADARMKNTMDRLAQTRNYISSLGGQAQQAQNSQYQAQQDPFKQQESLANMDMQRQQQQQNQANKEYEQQQESAFDPGKILGSAATGLFGAATGGLGAGLASGLGGLGGGLFDSKGSTKNADAGREAALKKR